MGKFALDQFFVAWVYALGWAIADTNLNINLDTNSNAEIQIEIYYAVF